VCVCVCVRARACVCVCICVCVISKETSPHHFSFPVQYAVVPYSNNKEYFNTINTTLLLIK